MKQFNIPYKSAIFHYKPEKQFIIIKPLSVLPCKLSTFFREIAKLNTKEVYILIDNNLTGKEIIRVIDNALEKHHVYLELDTLKWGKTETIRVEVSD